MLKLLCLFCICLPYVTSNPALTENLIQATFEFATLIRDSSFTNVRVFYSAAIQDSDTSVEEINSFMIPSLSRQFFISFVFVR